MANERTRKLFIDGLLIGSMAFFFLYGIKILNITYVEWLYDKGDLTMYYNGWQFYRSSKWFFPIGLMDTATYPDKISVLYSDSIPLLAVPFKLLSSVLPERFQYFGIWGLLCFALQGGIGASLLGKFIKNIPACLIGTLFLVFSPWMILRMYAHTALAAHWLILWAIYICLDKKAIKHNIAVWSLLLSMAVSVNLYFIPMLEIVLLFFTVYRILRQRDRLWQGGCLLCIPNFIAILILALLRAFSGEPNYNIGGLGTASSNLNFWLNPIGKSKFIKDFALAPYVSWPEEGFGYLGVGGLLLLVISAFIVFATPKIASWGGKHVVEIILPVIACFLFLILALGPEIAINNHVIFTWHYPRWVEILMNTFRSTGRFVWPICYILFLVSIIVIGVTMEKKAVLLLAICFCIQIVDLGRFYQERAAFVNEKRDYSGFSKIIPNTVMEDYDYCMVFDMSNWAEVGNFAAVNGLKLNYTYLARNNYSKIANYIERTMSELDEGIIRDRTLYVIFPDMDISLFKNTILYEIKGTLLAVKTKLPDMDAYLYTED